MSGPAAGAGGMADRVLAFQGFLTHRRAGGGFRALRKAPPWWELRGAKEVWLFMVEMGGIRSKREICDGPRSNVEDMEK